MVAQVQDVAAAQVQLTHLADAAVGTQARASDLGTAGLDETQHVGQRVDRLVHRSRAEVPRGHRGARREPATPCPRVRQIRECAAATSLETTAPIGNYGWKLRVILETGLSGNNSAH